eukprot:TRINITY_DN6764_c0_g3_i5.p1 TRINITY_DN6764_c0_g3~~TRINITY_DN6764_c0_g3_i5.p1  ORF type:complete len:816 (+),score=52.54 TRINITY_DN6764_c0_g3_i5:34-2481(+)
MIQQMYMRAFFLGYFFQEIYQVYFWYLHKQYYVNSCCRSFQFIELFLSVPRRQFSTWRVVFYFDVKNIQSTCALKLSSWESQQLTCSNRNKLIIVNLMIIDIKFFCYFGWLIGIIRNQHCDRSIDNIRHPIVGLHAPKNVKQDSNVVSFVLSPCSTYYFPVSMSPSQFDSGNVVKIQVFQPLIGGNQVNHVFNNQSLYVSNNTDSGYLRVCSQPPRMSLQDSNQCVKGSQAMIIQGGLVYQLILEKTFCGGEQGCWLGVENNYYGGALLIDIQTTTINSNSSGSGGDYKICQEIRPLESIIEIFTNVTQIESSISSCRQQQFKIIQNSQQPEDQNQIIEIYQECETSNCELGPNLEVCLKKWSSKQNSTILCMGVHQAIRAYTGWSWRLPLLQQNQERLSPTSALMLTVDNRQPKYKMEIKVEIIDHSLPAIPTPPIPDMPDSGNCVKGVSGYPYPTTQQYKTPLLYGKSTPVQISSCTQQFLILQAPKGDGHIEDITVIASVETEGEKSKCNLQHFQVCLMHPYKEENERIVECESPQPTGLFYVNEVELQTGFMDPLQILWLAIFDFNVDCDAVITLSQSGRFHGFLGISKTARFWITVSLFMFISACFLVLLFSCYWARSVRQFRAKIRAIQEGLLEGGLENGELLKLKFQLGTFLKPQYVCFGNWILFSAGLCVPGVISAMNTAELQNRDCNFGDYLCGSGCAAEYVSRQHLRSLKKMSRQVFKDFLASCFCYRCTVMQHHEELNEYYKQLQKEKNDSVINNLHESLLNTTGSSSDNILADSESNETTKVQFFNTRVTKREHMQHPWTQIM